MSIDLILLIIHLFYFYRLLDEEYVKESAKNISLVLCQNKDPLIKGLASLSDKILKGKMPYSRRFGDIYLTINISRS